MGRGILSFSMLFILVFSGAVQAKKVKYRKTQSVNFDEVDVDGLTRKPTGSYVLQKRGVDFVPLYRVREKFDNGILESIEYLR